MTEHSEQGEAEMEEVEQIVSGGDYDRYREDGGRMIRLSRGSW